MASGPYRAEADGAGAKWKRRSQEIADGIYRLSAHTMDIAPPAGFTFNQFLILGDEPMLFHTGLRKMFPQNLDALSRIVSPERLRWIAFGHFEADECGAMNEWLAAAPNATPAHGQTGCLVSLADFADRSPRALSDGETIDIGAGKRIRFVDTPHTPHGSVANLAGGGIPGIWTPGWIGATASRGGNSPPR
jgi:flavorubredoxin